MDDVFLPLPPSYSLLKWFVILGLFPFLTLFYRWISKTNHLKSSSGSQEIPRLKLPFFTIYGHVRTLPSRSVMKKMSLSLTSYVLQTLHGHCVIFQKEPVILIWMAFKSYIVLSRPESVEELLSSTVLLKKSTLYTTLHPWLGTGLLTSHGSKWKSRRKILTHSFHFEILKDFLPAFDEQSRVLVSILNTRCRSEEWIDITNPITLCSLDIICETTLGVHIGAQMGNESEYVEAVLRSTRAIMERIAAPLFHLDFVFNWTKLGRQFKKDINCLHSFTRKIIKEKKKALKSTEINLQDSGSQQCPPSKYKVKRKALMDLLLDIHMKDSQFTEEDIREEIDTFAFEGHDTTSMGMTWALYLIGLYPEVQRKIHQELHEIFGDDQDRHVTMDDLREMHYLECVLKESQRLYPSVPLLGRKVDEDMNLCGYKIKKGSEIGICSYILHRNPEVFPIPEKFDPDRFLPENCAGRNPFAFIPFSAGPRNCIGQRFAIMEEKIVVSNVLRNFQIKSKEQRDKICPAAEVILRSDRPLKLNFEPLKFPPSSNSSI